MVQFKVGDIVRVKNRAWYDSKKDNYGDICVFGDGVSTYFKANMTHLLSRFGFIKEIDNKGRVFVKFEIIDENSFPLYLLTSDMLEDKVYTVDDLQEQLHKNGFTTKEQKEEFYKKGFKASIITILEDKVWEDRQFELIKAAVQGLYRREDKGALKSGIAKDIVFFTGEVISEFRKRLEK